MSNVNFINWLQKAGLNTPTIQSLQNSGYNTIEVLKECQNDDINDIAASLNIQTLQKLKLKSALRQLHENESNKHKIISNEEQNAILDLTNFSTKIEEYTNDIDIEHNDFDKELNKFDEKMEHQFDLLFEELTKRKQILKKKLCRIAQDRIKSFESKKQQYQTQQRKINRVKSQCHQLLNDAINIEKLDKRKHKIRKMTKLLLNENANDRNHKHKHIPYHKPSEVIHFFTLLSESTFNCIKNLDIFVESFVHPKLLSVTNNSNNHIILMKWYIQQPSNEQVKIEWIKMDDKDTDWKHEDDDWNYKLAKNGNMEFPINVKQNGTYLCRISYFNIHLKENSMSNIMSISIKCHVLWDVLHSGNDVNFIGNRAKLSTDCWRTLFAKEVIQHKNKNGKDTYHYRLKIHHACDKGGGFMIGIIPDNNVTSTMTRSFTRYGGFAINKGGLLFPGGRRYTSVTWRDGDIIDIYVNMKLLTLSFAYNGISLGVASKNLPKQTYRFALTLLYQDDEVELIDLKE